MLRNPNTEEFHKCAELIQISGPELFKYIYNEKDQNILSLLLLFISAKKTTFSSDKIIIAEENGEVAGLILGHPVVDLSKFILNEIKSMFQFHGGLIKPLIHTAGMFSRLGLVSKYPKLNKDEYFIANLAVFKEYRGKGLSKKLLNNAALVASSMGLKKISLYVEIDNKLAIEVYKKYGFEEVDKVVFPKKCNKFGLYGFYKMVKGV